jgi:hypothetical protein
VQPKLTAPSLTPLSFSFASNSGVKVIPSLRPRTTIEGRYPLAQSIPTWARGYGSPHKGV